jgi:hypothetical protein
VRCKGRVSKGCGLARLQAFEGSGGNAIPNALGRRQIQQQDREPRVGHVRGDARSHRARTKDGYLANLIRGTALFHCMMHGGILRKLLCGQRRHIENSCF